jgi:DNA-binding GntR family transcriptional regulator
MEGLTQKHRAYNHIRSKMSVGNLRSGNRLSENELAEELGISRTPVREAIRQLESEGLVQQVPRFGTFVKRLSVDDFKRLWELRELIETYAAAKAAVKATALHVLKLRQFCDRSHELAKLVRKEHLSVEDVIAREPGEQSIDYEFHRTILRIADNPFIMKINETYSVMASLMQQSRPAADKTAITIEAQTYRDHYRIYKAIKNHDPDKASFWMRRHLQLALVSAIDALSAQSD